MKDVEQKTLLHPPEESDAVRKESAAVHKMLHMMQLADPLI